MYKTASITQSTIDLNNKNWEIMNDKWGVLNVLSDTLTHLSIKPAMEILHLARKVEEVSYRKWLSDQMVKSKLDFDKQSVHLKNEITRLTLANGKLTEKLVQFI